MKGKITYAELLQALKQMKNDKSPGLDGYTAEFYKFFGADLGIFLLRSINYGYETGSLSITQKQGVITCLPKSDRDRNYLKNWRPISLLNVVYKLASTVLANRMKTVLDSLIHEDQKGFISGRCISENVKLIYDVLFETKNQELPGLILSVDFEKATITKRLGITLTPLRLHAASTVRIPHSTNNFQNLLPTVRVTPLFSASTVNLHGASNSNMFRNNLQIRLSPLKSPILRKYINPFKRPGMYPSISKCNAKKCNCCNHLCSKTTITSSVNGRTFSVVNDSDLD